MAAIPVPLLPLEVSQDNIHHFNAKCITSLTSEAGIVVCLFSQGPCIAPAVPPDGKYSVSAWLLVPIQHHLGFKPLTFKPYLLHPTLQTL